MSTNKQALREAAEKGISEEGETWWNEDQLASDYGLALHRPDAKFIAAANPATVLALLDELEGEAGRIKELESQRALAFMACNRWRDKFVEAEAKLQAAEKRIAELGGHLKSAHAFIENTEAFGYEAASGILKCGDSEWNVDASKESLAAAGISVKGE